MTGPLDFEPLPERKEPEPFRCEPPYHRLDCVFSNCDDDEIRERCDPF